MRKVNSNVREQFIKVAVATGKEILTLQELKDLCEDNGHIST